MDTPSQGLLTVTKRPLNFVTALSLALIAPAISLLWWPNEVRSGAFGMVTLQLAMDQQESYEILQSFRTNGRLPDASENLAQDNTFIVAYVLSCAASLLGLGLICSTLSRRPAGIWISACAVGMLVSGGACDYLGENPKLEKLIGWAGSDSFADPLTIPIDVRELRAFAMAKFFFLAVAFCLWVALLVVALLPSYFAANSVRRCSAIAERGE